MRLAHDDSVVWGLFYDRGRLFELLKELFERRLHSVDGFLLLSDHLIKLADENLLVGQLRFNFDKSVFVHEGGIITPRVTCSSSGEQKLCVDRLARWPRGHCF